ncbi:MAG: hypothetical protein FJ109_15740 [Deltaproteobacteria bacterium]|nr:hypothetical protein [Deltaproteobacteria bacterium]
MARLRALLLLVLLPAATVSCGGGDGNPAEEIVADIPDIPSEGFGLFSTATLDSVMHVGSFACREDAMFVAVGAAEKTGIYKMELDAPELGWRQIYDQEALLTALTATLGVALPPGKS